MNEQVETNSDATSANTINRLRGAAHDATNNMSKFADKRNDPMAQYYAGMRDGLLRAIDLLENR